MSQNTDTAPQCPITFHLNLNVKFELNSAAFQLNYEM